MKKFFSAILLMAMMVFSVSTVVSCNDLVTEIEDVKGQVEAQAATIKTLNDEIAALETALSNAQSTADAAKKAAADAQAAADAAQGSADAAAKAAQAADENAKAAAATAKAEAIAEAKTQVEALKAAYETKVAEIETALAGKVSQAEIDAAVEAASKSVQAALDVINTKIAAIEETLAAKADKTDLDAQVATLLAADSKINTQLAALETYIKNLEVGGSANASQIDSIRTELAKASAEIEDLWADLKDENTGLFALVGKNASAITAMQEEFQASLDELWAQIYGEGANSLYTLVGQHAGLIQSLDERVTEAEKAVAAVNGNLVVFQNILGALVGQIQSLVYVPETWQNATYNVLTPIEFWLDEDGDYDNADYVSPLMIKATFELNPKGLVADLKEENLALSTVALKAAPAEYFPVKIIDRDSATGRFIVVAYIDEDSETYDNLYNYNANVAFALNIADAKIFNVEDSEGVQSTIDAGSYVTSSYVASYMGYYSYEITDALWLYYRTADGEDAIGKSYYETFYVPYTPVGEETKTNLFQVYGFVLNFAGTYLTIEEAEAVLGLDLNITHKDAVITYPNTPQGKKCPVVVEGKSFETTATLVGSDDYKDHLALGQVGTAVLKDFKVNGVPMTTTLTGNYEVTYKKADITLTSPDPITWSYVYGDYWTGDYLYDANNNYLGGAPELDVTGTDDITVLKTQNGEVFHPTQSVYFNGEAVAKDGTKYYGTIAVRSLSKKALRIDSGYLEFAQGESLTYKFTTILYDDKNVAYTTVFEVEVGPMPTDKTITLDPVTVQGRTSSPMSADITPLTEALTTDAAFYPELADAKKKAALVSAFFNNYYEVEFNVFKGKTDVTSSNYSFNFDYNEGTAAEASTIGIASATFGDVLTFVEKIVVFGVEYTFKVDATVVKPSFTLTANQMFVNLADNTVDPRGTVTLPKFTKNVGTTAGVTYELPLIDVRDYVLVNGETAADIAAQELMLTYAVTNQLKDKQGNVVYSPDDYATLAADWDYTDAKDPEYCYNKMTWTPAIYLDNNSNPVAGVGIYNNRVNLAYELLATNDATISYGKVSVSVVVPELVTFSTVAPNKAKQQGAYSEYLNEEWTPVNVVKALRVYDAATTKELYNAYAENLEQIWDGNQYNTTDKTYETIAGSAHYNVYGQTAVVVDHSKVTAVYATTGAAVPSNLYVVEDNGDVYLANNTAHIQDDIIVRVPVSFLHNYCGTAHAATAQVRFYK